MKTIRLTESEVRALGSYLSSNPCSSGCVYPEMQDRKKDCKDCPLIKDRNSIITKLFLI